MGKKDLVECRHEENGNLMEIIRVAVQLLLLAAQHASQITMGGHRSATDKTKQIQTQVN